MRKPLRAYTEIEGGGPDGNGMLAGGPEGGRPPRMPGELRTRTLRDEVLRYRHRERLGHGLQNPCDGIRNARLKREDAFSHAMIIVSSATVSSS